MYHIYISFFFLSIYMLFFSLPLPLSLSFTISNYFVCLFVCFFLVIFLVSQYENVLFSRCLFFFLHISFCFRFVINENIGGSVTKITEFFCQNLFKKNYTFNYLKLHHSIIAAITITLCSYPLQ